MQRATKAAQVWSPSSFLVDVGTADRSEYAHVFVLETCWCCPPLGILIRVDAAFLIVYQHDQKGQEQWQTEIAFNHQLSAVVACMPMQITLILIHTCFSCEARRAVPAAQAIPG